MHSMTILIVIFPSFVISPEKAENIMILLEYFMLLAMDIYAMSQ